MAIRTNTKTVTFNHPFHLADMEEMQPAGAYEVETDEELIEGLSFIVWRRRRSLIHLPGTTGSAKLMQVMEVDPKELDAALRRDSEPRQEIDFATRFDEPSEKTYVEKTPDTSKSPPITKTILQLARELRRRVKIDRLFRVIREGRDPK